MSAAPPNGLVCFFGETLDHGFVAEVLTPPLPVIMGNYDCGSSFRTDMWEALNATYPTIGLVVLNGTKAILGIAKGPHLWTLKTMTGMLSSSTRRGGQSANRIQRLHDESIVNWLKEVEAQVKLHIFPHLNGSLNKDKLLSLVIGGPADTKHLLASRLSLASQSTFTTPTVSLEELASHLPAWLTAKESRAIKQALVPLEEVISLEPDKLLIGPKEVRGPVKEGRVKTVYLADDGRYSKDKIKHIQDVCSSFGTTCLIIPSLHLTTFLLEAGMVAILRY